MVDLQGAILVEYYNKQMNFHHVKRDDILHPKLIHFVHRFRGLFVIRQKTKIYKHNSINK